MSAAHTPGPWAVNPFVAQVDAFDSGEPLPVCQLLWPTDQRTEDQTFANGNLIAAAPELYEALDEALGLILDAYQLQTYDAEAVKRLEGVLAKAKAEQVPA
jgi:hypothetical protein